MAPVREPQADEAASLRLVELMIVRGKVHHLELLRQKVQKSAGEERAALPVQRSLKKELSNASEDMDLSLNPMLLDTEAAVAVEEMEESLPAEDSLPRAWARCRRQGHAVQEERKGGFCLL